MSVHIVNRVVIMHDILHDCVTSLVLWNNKSAITDAKYDDVRVE